MTNYTYNKKTGKWTVKTLETMDPAVKQLLVEYFLYLVADRPLPGGCNLYHFNKIGSNFGAWLKDGDSFEADGVPDNANGIVCISGGGFNRSRTNAEQLLKWMLWEDPIETNDDIFKDNWNNVRYHCHELSLTSLVVVSYGDNKFFHRLSTAELCWGLYELAHNMQYEDEIDTSNFLNAVNKYWGNLGDE